MLLSQTLERWSATAFLAAGGSLLTAAAINGMGVFTAIETQAGILLWLEGVTGFGGALLTFVGLLGLYPRLSGAAPRLARTGILLAVGPTISFAVALVACSFLAPLLGFPSLKTLVPSFVTITGGILLLFAVALGIFGVASLRTSLPSRLVGGCLVVTAAAWFVFLGATWTYAPDTPVWVTFIQTTTMAAPLTFIGYRLRIHPEWTHDSISSAVHPGGRSTVEK